ncbi:ABC transporter ATP-binding protein [Palleronia sp. LCG004]|uniref:ABC transporter ATP-binding protein n=1 Tax=Palleronia sp. LCG004 TaxID=3079304 RepID=UPI002941E2BE|nr:ABC transporter ATP-binding protein [Palleronia sp. LCG004]WOI57866.1 ABC transporter ATP-binding protein [Palleronia sp. LCG004]
MKIDTRIQGTAMTTDTHLSIREVGKIYGEGKKTFEAIGSVSLDIRRGEFLSIVGPSGCGKSTLLKIMAGLLPATSGEVRMNDQVVSEPPENMVYLFQQYSRSLLPWLTVEENVAFGFEHRIKMSAAERRAVCNDFLGKVGLGDMGAKYPSELSGGMQQRVAIARALAARPELLLLDEPFSSVDALTRLELHELILDLWAASGLTVVLVTHDVEEAIYLSDRIAILGKRPSRVEEVIETELPRPRDPVATQGMPRYQELRGRLLTRLLGGREFHN